MELMENNTLLIGLPASGKSTFIAALWDLLNESDNENFKLKMDARPAERAFLERIYDKWVGFEKLDRTRIDSIESINLSILKGECSLELNFPDLAGEVFVDMYRYREVPEDIETLIRSCNSIVIFINPEFLDVDRHIDDIYSTMPINIGGATLLTDPEGVTNQNLYDKLHSQVVLTDLLYGFKQIQPLMKKVAVVISAWDCVEPIGLNCSPEKYLKGTCPLLYMYLKNGNFSYKIYGVSAQGCNYEKAEELKQLQELDKSIYRIKVVDGNVVGNDISIPFNWLLE